VPVPRFVETESHTEADAEAEGENESESESEGEGEMEVHMEADSSASQMVEADVATKSDAELEAQAQAEAEDGFVHVTHTPYHTTRVSSDFSNIQRIRPRTVHHQSVQPLGGADMARNGPVNPAIPQDPLARKIDCNYYDCTGMQSEPYVPAGSLNPVIPWRYNREPRTTTFSTVPDMLEPYAEQKTVILN